MGQCIREEHQFIIVALMWLLLNVCLHKDGYRPGYLLEEPDGLRWTCGDATQMRPEECMVLGW